MKEEIVLLGNQKITLGMSTIKVKEAYRLMHKKQIPKYCKLFLIINSFSLLALFDQNVMDVKIIIEPFNDINTHNGG